MLGKTAGALIWMFRYMERCENTARLADAGFYIALTRASSADAEWASIVAAAGLTDAYRARHDGFDSDRVVDFLLRDPANPASVLSMMDRTRSNARVARTALTREVWEAVNEAWLNICEALRAPVEGRHLPRVLALVRRQSALVQGALHGTMLRNDIYDFAQLGTYLERTDSTARILDVKYYVLLPKAASVGGAMDNIQWETILRCVSALRSYHWVHKGAATPRGISEFLILDPTLPRSLVFSGARVADALARLDRGRGKANPASSLASARETLDALHRTTIDDVFATGLHEFLTSHIARNAALAEQVERDYRCHT